MGIAWVVFRENVDRRLLLGAFAILAGAFILSWQGEARFQWSVLLISGACLCWGIDNNLTRKLSSSDPVQIAMLKGLVAGAVNLTLALSEGAALPSGGTVAVVCVVGFLGYGREPCPVRSRPTVSGDGSHECIFLACAVCWSDAGGRYAGRAAILAATRCWWPDGLRPLAASGRTS